MEGENVQGRGGTCGEGAWRSGQGVQQGRAGGGGEMWKAELSQGGGRRWGEVSVPGTHHTALYKQILLELQKKKGHGLAAHTPPHSRPPPTPRQAPSLGRRDPEMGGAPGRPRALGLQGMARLAPGRPLQSRRGQCLPSQLWLGHSAPLQGSPRSPVPRAPR